MLSWLRDSCWPTGVTASAQNPATRLLQRGSHILSLPESQGHRVAEPASQELPYSSTTLWVALSSGEGGFTFSSQT